MNRHDCKVGSVGVVGACVNRVSVIEQSGEHLRETDHLRRVLVDSVDCLD